MANDTNGSRVSTSRYSKWQLFWNRGGWWKAVLAAVLYIVFYELASLLVGKVFGSVLDSTGPLGSVLNAFLELTLPVMIGSVALLLFAYSLGWLPKPLFTKQPIKGKWWMWIAVILVGSTITLRLFGIGYGAYSVGLIATVFLAGIFIGLSEELLTRGIAVNLLRQKGYGEWQVMILSSLIFALLHSVNLLSGQKVLTVLLTMVFTFGFGIMMYLALRVTQNLIFPMILHGMTDPTTILATGGIDTHGANNPSILLSIAGLSTIAFLTFALIAIIFVRGKVPSKASQV